MPADALRALGGAAEKKVGLLRGHMLGYIVSAMLAGAYVGVGVFLAFSVGGPLAAAGSPWQKVAMGASFAVALSLVVFAGAELFTGNALTMPVGLSRRVTSPIGMLQVWVMSWLGNLLGAALLAWLLYVSGVMNGGSELALVQAVAAKKMHLAVPALVARGILCNWLVCLGVWCAYRMKSESGKLIMIFWCLYSFVAAGFEHSVANMTLFSLALLQPHAAAVSIGGAAYNLAWVTVGNLIGGGVLVAAAYRVVEKGTEQAASSVGGSEREAPVVH